MRPSTTIDGRYLIERPCGAGGMGTVYRALDRRAQRPVAVKVVHEDAERFEREAALLAQLDHPEIVRYVDEGELRDGGRYLVMEWIEGCSLDERLANGTLSPAAAVELARRLAAALGHAHAMGVVHRDVKPQNVMLRDGQLDRLCLIDFGIARDHGRPRLTRTGLVVGTPGYMAPEQARGEREVGPAADVFALGCLLYECITGAAAFPGDSPTAVWTKVLLAEPPELRALYPDCSEELAEALSRLLAKRAGDRPADGAGAAALLAAVPAQPQAALAIGRPRAEEVPTHAGGETRARGAQVVALLGPSQSAPASVELSAPGHAERVQLPGGWSLVRFADDGGGLRTAAARAARWALSLRDSGVDAPLVLLCAGDGDALGSLDALLARAERFAAGRPSRDAVAVDETLARILQSDHAIEGGIGARWITRSSSARG